MNAKNTLILKAESWASSLWSDALPRWSGRSGQDKNYRKHVVHPAILSLLRKNFPEGEIRILELGCGDGVFLDDTGLKALIDNGGSYSGIDISSKLVEEARLKHTAENIVFLRVSMADTALFDRIVSQNESWNCILSVFAIQEVPDIESMMENLLRILPEGVLTVFVTVHPDFGEWLMQEGRMRKEEELASGIEQEELQWRWAGYYPIVDEPLEAFYLPYFHRNLEDYRSIFARYGFFTQDIVELPEKKHELPQLVKRGISPFTPFETNLYWPRIGEVPSSIVFLARKEK